MIVRLKTASSGVWDVQNTKGDRFVVRFGIVTETRDLGTVYDLIAGRWCLAILRPTQEQSR